MSREAWALALCCAACVACSSEAAPITPPAEPQRAEAGPQHVAVLVEVEGDVRAQEGAGRLWAPISVGARLAPGTSIQTFAGGRAVLRLEPDGGLVTIDERTTLRVPVATPRAPVLPMTGTFSARVGAGEEPLAIVLPPGTLVLREGAGASPTEAHVEVDPSGATIEMVAGEGQLVTGDEPDRVLRARSWTRFAPDGAVEDEGVRGPAVELSEPRDGATVRTRDEVTLRWGAVEGADAYQIRIEGAELSLRATASGTSVTMPFPAGEHRWSVRALRGGEPLPPSEERAVHVEIDREVPVVSLASPPPGAVVSAATVRVAGRTEPGATIEAGGAVVRAGRDGSFSMEVPIGRGLTNIVIRVGDDLGNERVHSRAVVRE